MFDLEYQIKEISFLFELYHKMPLEDVITIFKGFPYLLCVRPEKILKFCG